MILEGLVTTLSATGEVNLAPMGPAVDPSVTTLLLRPFQSSQTFRNLQAHPEGVFHVTDDVLMLAQAAVSSVSPLPSLVPAEKVKGWVIANACRAFEFRVSKVHDQEDRATLEVEILRRHTLRDFFGFNRAKHAVVEAAILATRTHLLPWAHIEAEFSRLRVLVDKTGGEQEQAGFAFLHEYLQRTKQAERSVGDRP